MGGAGGHQQRPAVIVRRALHDRKPGAKFKRVERRLLAGPLLIRPTLPSHRDMAQPLSRTVAGANLADITVRSMTHVDVASVTEVHLEAFPGFFLTTLGRGFLSYYYRMFPTRPGTIALVGERAPGQGIDGFVVGACNPRGFYRRLVREHWFGFGGRALLALGRRPSAARRLLRGLTHSAGSPPGPDLVGLFSIAVAPRAQGSGLAGLLMQTFLARAAERGAKSVVLHTDAVDNERANAYYRNYGFQIGRIITTPEGRRLHEYIRSLGAAEGSRATNN